MREMREWQTRLIENLHADGLTNYDKIVEALTDVSALKRLDLSNTPILIIRAAMIYAPDVVVHLINDNTIYQKFRGWDICDLAGRYGRLDLLQYCWAHWPDHLFQFPYLAIKHNQLHIVQWWFSCVRSEDHVRQLKGMANTRSIQKLFIRLISNRKMLPMTELLLLKLRRLRERLLVPFKLCRVGTLPLLQMLHPSQKQLNRALFIGLEYSNDVCELHRLFQAGARFLREKILEKYDERTWNFLQVFPLPEAQIAFSPQPFVVFTWPNFWFKCKQLTHNSQMTPEEILSTPRILLMYVFDNVTIYLIRIHLPSAIANIIRHYFWDATITRSALRSIFLGQKLCP